MGTPVNSLCEEEDSPAKPENIDQFAKEIADLAKQASQAQSAEMEGNPCDWISRFEASVRARLQTKFTEMQNWVMKSGVKRTSSGVFKHRTGCVLDDSKGDEFDCDMSPIKPRKSNHSWLDDPGTQSSPSPQADKSLSIRIDSPKKRERSVILPSE